MSPKLMIKIICWTNLESKQCTYYTNGSRYKRSIESVHMPALLGLEPGVLDM